MKHPFQKDRISEIQRLQDMNGRDLWGIVRSMQEENGFCRQTDREEFLLQKGAYLGDVWSMTELARYLYRKGNVGLPQALSWWYKAAKAGDAGSLADLKYYDIEDRITKYFCEGCSEYSNMEVQCAMLTEWVLTDLGRTDWKSLAQDEKERRCRELLSKCCPLFGLSDLKLNFVKNLSLNGKRAHGIAYPGQNRIEIDSAVLEDYERLIQVLFHEAGHHIVWSMYNLSSEDAKRQRERFGISEDRVRKWYSNEMGISVPVTEEDPDTLSYGVWMTWCIYFR